MSQAEHDRRIDHVEVPATDVAATRAFDRETLGFPGGRRFHFADPSGNELAVGSET